MHRAGIAHRVQASSAMMSIARCTAVLRVKHQPTTTDKRS